MSTDTDTDALAPGSQVVLEGDGLATLIVGLRAAGFTVLGPTPGERAIVHDEIMGIEDLPEGWTADAGAGSYRLRRRQDRARFGHAVNQHSWKHVLFTPRLELWRSTRERPRGCLQIEARPQAIPRLALLGVRPCDLAAIAVQDVILIGGRHVDVDYAARRTALLVIVVNCGTPGGTCFCASMGTGPRATTGFDLALTELLDRGEPRYLAQVGTTAGARALAGVAVRRADADELDAADRLCERASRSMGRHLDQTEIRDLLYRNLEHPRWDDVAARCLACTNCTLVCPTCFCYATEVTSDLAGQHAVLARRWDSCFTLGHSFLHGGPVRPSHRARYRQWLVHKLGAWIDQFGSSGCVGCGRCITWCPVGIDITEEVAAIRAAR